MSTEISVSPFRGEGGAVSQSHLARLDQQWEKLKQTNQDGQVIDAFYKHVVRAKAIAPEDRSIALKWLKWDVDRRLQSEEGPRAFALFQILDRSFSLLKNWEPARTYICENRVKTALKSPAYMDFDQMVGFGRWEKKECLKNLSYWQETCELLETAYESSDNQGKLPAMYLSFVNLLLTYTITPTGDDIVWMSACLDKYDTIVGSATLPPQGCELAFAIREAFRQEQSLAAGKELTAPIVEMADMADFVGTEAKEDQTWKLLQDRLNEISSDPAAMTEEHCRKLIQLAVQYEQQEGSVAEPIKGLHRDAYKGEDAAVLLFDRAAEVALHLDRLDWMMLCTHQAHELNESRSAMTGMGVITSLRTLLSTQSYSYKCLADLLIRVSSNS